MTVFFPIHGLRFQRKIVNLYTIPGIDISNNVVLRDCFAGETRPNRGPWMGKKNGNAPAPMAFLDAMGRFLH